MKARCDTIEERMEVGDLKMKQQIEVVAALIQQVKDGKKQILIAQRPANKASGLLWEFVGGKVEAGETKEAALIRECREELGIKVQPHEIYFETTHEYPDIFVHLTLFEASILDGTPQLIEHSDLRWVSPMETDDFPFCPADTQILKKLQYTCAVEQIPLGKWRHFKGMEYEVIGIAKHSETLDPLVVYRALYGDGLFWIRPVRMWLETVERDGKRFPRFTYIGDQA